MLQTNLSIMLLCYTEIKHPDWLKKPSLGLFRSTALLRQSLLRVLFGELLVKLGNFVFQHLVTLPMLQANVSIMLLCYTEIKHSIIG